jgi:hypothetical protein
MKAILIVLLCFLGTSGCNRKLSITNKQNYEQSDSSINYSDSSRLHIKERSIKTTNYGDQLTGNITIPAGILHEVSTLPLLTDSLESSGIKLKTTVTRDSTGNLKIGLNATAKPVTVQDIKEKQYSEKKGIAGKSEIKTTSLQTDYNKQVTSTSMPWLIWLLVFIAIGLLFKYILKLF